MLFLFLFLQATPAQALPAGFQEYYVLGNEEQIWRMFNYIQSQEGVASINTNMCSVVTLVATTDNQIIYYDHWEDGYEVDIFNPTQGSTEVYGDGNTGNGGSGSDILTAGDIISLNSDRNNTTINGSVPTNPRNASEIRYDSNDYVLSSGGPVDLAHAVWPYDQSFIGGAWEIYSLQAYQTAYSYRLPIGVDLYDGDTGGYFGDFKYTWLQLEALYDNTNVSIDNGASTINITLDKGQTYSSMGYIDSTTAPAITVNAGTQIVSDQPTQVGLITGADGTFQTRFLVVLPDLVWGQEYIVPVPSSASHPAQLYIFNPNDEAITVTASDADGTGTFSIPANVTGSTVAYSQPGTMNRYIPTDSAARLVSNKPFGVVVTADTSQTAYDWGLSAIPAKYLTEDYYLSWAPGSSDTPPANNGSPAWVTPLTDDTTFYVDYGPVDGLVDLTFSLDALEQKRIFDPDNDNTGMHIWATGKFAIAWGEDPATAGGGTPYLDLGLTTLPLYQGWLNPVLTLEKTADPETLPTTGGTVTFNLQVDTYSLVPVTNVNLTDALPAGWTYTPGTTVVTYPDGSTANPEPTQNGQNLSWNLSQTMNSNQTLELQFQAQIQTGGSVGVTRADDFEDGQVYNGGTDNWSSDWIETGDNNNPASGEIQIIDPEGVAPYAGSWQLRLWDDNVSIERSADLSEFARPMLRFKRNAYSLDNGSEHFYLDIYDGALWHNSLITWTDGSQEGTWVQEEIDLSTYAATTTTIRFRSPAESKNNDDRLYLDDIEIYDAAVVNKNQAEVAGEYNGHSFNATDDATVSISALNLEKTVDKSTAEIGDTLLYTLTYENRGATSTNDAYIKDAVPLGTTFSSASGGGIYTEASNTIRWTLGDVAPSATGAVTFTVTVNDGAANGAIIENVGRIDSDQTEMANSNVARTTVLAPDLSLSKSGSPIAAPGDVVTYTLNYANNGDASATGVVISDTIPASTIYVVGSLAINSGSGWVSLSDAVDADAGQYVDSVVRVKPGTAPGALAAGETGQIRFEVTVDAGAPEGSTIGNVARISSDQAPAQNSNLLVTDVSPLSISKASDRSVAAAGQTAVFTITYGNNGDSTLTNVSLLDSVPANTELISDTVTGVGMDAIEYSTDNGATWSSSFTNPASVTDIRWRRTDLPAGQTGAVNFQVRLADPLPANTTIQNTARITSTETAASGWLYSNQVSINTRTENFLMIDTPPANLITNTVSISYSGATNPNATVVITNTATGVIYTVVADGFGNFATTITLTPGSNTLTAQSIDLNDDTAADNRSVTYTPDLTTDDNFVTIIQPATDTVTSTATISVTGATDPGSVLTVTVGSAGPYTTTADDSGAYSVSVTLPDVGVNTIVVTSTDLFGNEATASRDVQLTNGSPSLEFSKSALDVDGPPLLISDTVRYTLQMTNTGSYTAFNVVVTDTLPVSVTLVSTSTTQGAASGSEQIVWNVGDVSPNNGTATMIITVTLDPDTEGQSIINTATVEGDNVVSTSDDVCPDGSVPDNGVCDNPPQKPSPSSGPGGIFLPIILKSS